MGSTHSGWTWLPSGDPQILLSASTQLPTNAPHFSLTAQVQRTQVLGSETGLQSHLCDLGQVLWTYKSDLPSGLLGAAEPVGAWCAVSTTFFPSGAQPPGTTLIVSPLCLGSQLRKELGTGALGLPPVADDSAGSFGIYIPPRASQKEATNFRAE